MSTGPGQTYPAGAILLIFSEHTAPVYTFAVSPDGTKIASGSYDSTVKIWDPNTGSVLTNFTEHAGPVRKVVFAADSVTVASVSTEDGIKVWNANTGELITYFDKHESWPYSAAFSPNGDKVVSGARYGTIKMWNAQTGSTLLILKGHDQPIWDIDYSPDGTKILSASSDDTIKVWNAETGSCLLTFTGHSGSVWTASFSPDGSKIASGAHDNTVKVWDAATGQILCDFTEHTGDVYDVNFSQDGSKIISASFDETVKIWDATTGQVLINFTRHEHPVSSASFLPDGTRAVSGSLGDIAKVWGTGFEPILEELALKYSAGENGSLEGELNQTVLYGQNGTPVTAVPDEGYRFIEWSDGQTDNPRTDVSVTKDIEVTAIFDLEEYVLIYTAGEGGTLEGETEQIVARYSDGTLVEAVPNEGYQFVRWSDSITDNPRTDTNVQADIEVEAIFEPNEYTLIYTAGENGSLLGETEQIIAHGSSGTQVEAVPDEGYEFAKWDDGSTQNPRIDTNVTEDIDVEAIFDTKLLLTYIAGEGGTIEGQAEQSVACGSDGAPVTAVPDEGYEFVQWSDGLVDNPRTDRNVTDDITVEAEFALIEYTLVYLAGPGGQIIGESEQIVSHGSSGSPVEAIPSTPKHRFSHWDDGSTENPRTDTNVTLNLEVTAVFEEEDIYEIQLISFPEGAGELFGGGKYYASQLTTTVAEAKPGFVFSFWTESGNFVSNKAEYIFTVQSNRLLVAHFKPVTTLQITVQGSGFTSPVPGYHVLFPGDIIDLQAIADDNWFLKHWIHPDSGEEITEPVFTWTAGNQKGYKAVAVFEEIDYAYVYLSSNPANGGSTSGAGHYPLGLTAKIIAQPEEGCEFVEWTVDGEHVSSQAEYSFVVENNINFTAHFIPKEYIINTVASPAYGGETVGRGTYRHGDEVTLQAMPSESYAFKHWAEISQPEKDLRIVSNSAIYSFTAERSRNLVAVFESSFHEDSVSLGKPPMIWYNIPYRGAFEYDKFVLNYMQLSNAMLFLQGNIGRSQLSLPNNLEALEKKLEKLYQMLEEEQLSSKLHIEKLIKS